jgi:hypothetical protein
MRKEVKMNMQLMSMMRKDFVASCLRSQLNRLQDVLNNIEEESKVEGDFATDSLREVETSLRKIRKMCVDN